MRYSVVIASVLLLLLPLRASGQDAVDLLQVTEKYGQAEVEIAYPGFSAMTQLASRFPVSSCDGKKAVLTLARRDIDDFHKTGIPYEIIRRGETKSVYTAETVAEAMQWKSYPTWKQYDTIMHLIAESWPDVCLLDTIGFSIMGRAILVLKISDNVSSDEHEPPVMLSASMHGDELAGFVLMMRLAEYLASHSNDGSLAQKLVSGLEIWINPLSNPDGMYRTYDTILYPVRANSNGYDLNRNYPDPDISYPDPVQKENLEMISFLRDKSFVLSANLHSGVEVINYPWDKWSRLHADDEWFENISRRYADTVHNNAESGYMTYLTNGITRGSVWYVVKGGRQDFVTWELRGREVTMELDDEKQTPATRLDALWNYNHRSLLRYLEEALYGVRGTVTTKDTELPVGARIFITGHDADSSHIYADTISGAYVRFLSPGTWSLTFTAAGYEPYVAGNVTVAWNEMTSLNIIMEKGDPYPDPPVSGLLIYPVPWEGPAPVKIIAPSIIAGRVMVMVTSVSGALIHSHTRTIEAGIPFEENFSHFPAGIYVISVKKLPAGPVSRSKIVISTCAQR